jgi:carbonic anhydrase
MSDSYPIEMHLVHMSPRYASISAAKASRDPTALAVLGVLFEVSLLKKLYRESTARSPFFRLQLSSEDNPFLEPIVQALPNVKQPDTTYTLPSPIALAFLLPVETADFYRYEGSLTTPGCSEVVTWSVLRKRLPISERQVKLVWYCKINEEQRSHACTSHCQLLHCTY